MISHNLHSMIPFKSLIFPLPLSEITLEEEVIENSNQKDPLPHPFFPRFRRSNELWNEFFQAGLCDRFSKASEKIKHLKIPSIPIHSDYGKIIKKRIEDSLKEKLELAIDDLLIERKKILESLNVNQIYIADVVIEEEFAKLKAEKIIISTREIFEEFIDELKLLSSEEIWEILQEFYKIGSSVIPLLGMEFFEHSTIALFEEWFTSEIIHQWFLTMEHLRANASPRVNDDDYRIIFKKNCPQYGARLANIILKIFSGKISERTGNLFGKYFPNLLKKGFSHEESYILNSRAICNRQIITLKKTRYAIIAINTLKKPIDFNFVCVNQKSEPFLENLNLSSRQSFKINQFKFLKPYEHLLESIEVCTKPFGIQAVLDYLFDCASPATHKLDGFIDFLRRCPIMRDPDDNLKMVEEALKLKRKFEKNKGYTRKVEIDWKTSDLTKQEAFSNGGFLYLILRQNFSKIEKDCPNIIEDPYFVAGFVFRACQSFSTYSSYNDGDFSLLWSYINKFYWKDKKGASPIPALNEEIKKALVDDKVPFSVLSSWIGLLTWFWDPKSADIHCDQPVFHKKKLLLSILNINPVENCLCVHNYLSTNAFSKSLENIYLIIANANSINLHEFPLLKFIPSLKIDPQAFRRHAEKWLFHPVPVLNTLGLQLYLTLFTFHPEQSSLEDIIQRLPHLLQGTANTQQQNEILYTIDRILIKFFQKPSCLLEQFENRDIKTLSKKQWIQELIKSNDPEFILMSLSLWKNSLDDEIGWHLFRALTQSNLHQALSVYQLLFRRPKPFVEVIDETSLFFSKLKNIELDHVIISDMMRKLFTPLFDKSNLIQFKDNTQKKCFSEEFKDIFYKITCLNPPMGDTILLDMSYRGFLDSFTKESIWKKRINQLVGEKKLESDRYAAIFYKIGIENEWISSNEEWILPEEKAFLELWTENFIKKPSLNEIVKKSREEIFFLIDRFIVYTEASIELPSSLKEAQQRNFLDSILNLLSIQIGNLQPEDKLDYYLNKIKQILPHINNLIFSENPISESSKLVSKLIKVLTISKKKGNRITEAELQFNTKRKKLLLDWVESLYKNENNSSCDYIIFILFKMMFSKSASFLFAQSKKSSRILNKSTEFIEKFGNPTQKIFQKLISLFCSIEILKKSQSAYSKEFIEILRLLDLNNEKDHSNNFFIFLIYTFFISKNSKNIPLKSFLVSLEIFEKCLDSFKIRIENSPSHLHHPLLKELQNFIKKGFENQWLLLNRPKSLEFVCWAKPRLTSCEDPILKLIFILSEESKITKENCETYEQGISHLIPDLSKIIIQTKLFNFSYSLIYLIKYLPITDPKKVNLFSRFLIGFSEVKIPEADRRDIIQHCEYLCSLFPNDKEKLLLILKRLNLEKVKDKITLKPISSEVFPIKKMLNEYFKNKFI